MALTDEMKKDFVHFLKKHNAYGKYRKAYFEEKMLVLNPFNLLNEPLNQQINYAFCWTKTNEGEDFWWELNEKWRKFCIERFVINKKKQ